MDSQHVEKWDGGGGTTPFPDRVWMMCNCLFAMFGGKFAVT